MSLSTRRVGLLVWVFIYGGLFLVSVGAALLRGASDLGGYAIGAGAVLVLAGAALVWVRSRMRVNPQESS